MSEDVWAAEVDLKAAVTEFEAALPGWWLVYAAGRAGCGHGERLFHIRCGFGAQEHAAAIREITREAVASVPTLENATAITQVIPEDQRMFFPAPAP